MNAPRILLAEDDPNLGRILREYLEVKGFAPALYVDGAAALSAFELGTWELCILDVMLPKQDGFSVARAIRRHDAQVPILFLTAKASLDDKYEGFSIGGDDYLTKPFSMEELLLRLRALLRRAGGPGGAGAEATATRFQVGKYAFDYPTRELSHEGHLQRLTSREAELLRLLCQQHGEVLRRETALRLIWGDDSYFNARSMDVFLTRLRKYLKDDPRIELMNVHGMGFKLVVRA
jgi:DNA-binding response OmpR family regulator